MEGKVSAGAQEVARHHGGARHADLLQASCQVGTKGVAGARHRNGAARGSQVGRVPADAGAGGSNGQRTAQRHVDGAAGFQNGAGVRGATFDHQGHRRVAHAGFEVACGHPGAGAGGQHLDFGGVGALEREVAADREGPGDRGLQTDDAHHG